DADERVAVQWADGGDHRQPPDELRNQAELDQVLRSYIVEGVVRFGSTSGDVIVKAQWALTDPLGDDVVEAGECTADDEQHVGSVDLDEVLVWMFPTALRRHRCRRALQDLQQCLLDAFAGYITSDRGILALPGDLVDLVDVDDPGLGLLDIEVGRLNELEQD